MKKYILCALIVAAASCCGYFMFGSSTSQDHSNMIPDDATAIVVFDAKTVLEETSISYDSFGDNIESIGLDLSEPVYLFLTSNGYLGASAKLNNVKEFESCLTEIRDMNGFTWGIFDGGLCCHDGDRALIVGPSATWSDKTILAEMLLLMKKDNNSSDIFEILNQQDGGFKARLSFKALPEFVVAEVKKEALKYGYDIEKIDYQSLYLNLSSGFTNNSVSLLFSVDSSNDDIKENIQAFKDSLRCINGSTTRYIPEENVMWLCMNLDGQKILSYLKSDKNANDALTQIMSIFDVEGFINALDGDALITLGNLDLQNPKIGVIAQVGNYDFANADFKKMVNTFGFSFNEVINNGDKFSFLTTSDSFAEELINNNHEKGEGHDYGIFYLSVDVDKTMNILKPLYLLNDYPEELISYAEDVNHIRVCLTKDDLSFTFEFKSPFNDLITRWTE